MRRAIPVVILLLGAVVSAWGQATPRGGVDFGRDRQQPILANPYNVGIARDEVVKAIERVLEEQRLPKNVQESKPTEGLILTEKIVFSKGIGPAINNLRHFANVPAYETRIWRQARVLINFRVVTIDASNSQLFITAKFEGLSQGTGLANEWVAATSNGVLEQCFLQAVLETLGVITPQGTTNQREDCNLCLRGCG